MLSVHELIPQPETPEEALQIEQELARKLTLGDKFQNVAGVDIAYSRDDKTAYVVATVLSTTTWSVVAEQKRALKNTHPYDKEGMGWREAQKMIQVLTSLPLKPDVIFVDGHGVAHPQRFGLACHVGLALDHPTIGVSEMWPQGCREATLALPKRRGNKAGLLHQKGGGNVGYQVFLQDNLEPVFVSPGNRVSSDDAVLLTLKASPWYPLPEPLRRAKEAALLFKQEQEP